MSLWRRGIVLSCHPAGPGSIPGVGAWHFWDPLNLHFDFQFYSGVISIRKNLLSNSWEIVAWFSLLFEAINLFLIGWSKSVCIIYSCNSCIFRCMSLWRRGNVLTCHPLGPRSIPCVGIHLITEAFNWLCILAYSDESRKHFLTQVSHLIRIGCINQFVYMFFFVSVLGMYLYMTFFHLFSYRSPWRCGSVLSLHPVDPRSRPGDVH
jgi:hypothetical protein